MYKKAFATHLCLLFTGLHEKGVMFVNQSDHFKTDADLYFHRSPVCWRKQMKSFFAKTTAWLLWTNLALLMALSLSCCQSNGDAKPANTGNAAAEAASTEGGGYPAKMAEAIAKGKKEKKLTVIEVYDHECNFCLAMNNVLGSKDVIDAIGKLVYCRITIEEEDVIDEFGITQSPTYLMFDHNGEYMEPFVTGFRSPNVLAAELDMYRLKCEGKEAPPIPEDPHPDYGKG